MSPRCLPLAFVCALLSTAVVRGAHVPYTGIANQDGAEVRSGPGEEYYATDTLRRGDVVEVHRIDEGGWCAIRPVAGSFSRVAAHHLRETETPGVAEVGDDEAWAYVGSRIREDRDVVQVRLNRGEFIEILGSEDLPDEKTGRAQKWHRISPPAGEFRWVHLEHVDRKSPAARPQPAGVAVTRRAAPAARRSSTQSQDRLAADSGPATSQLRRDAPAGGSGPRSASENASRATAAQSPQPKAFAARWRPLPPGTLDRRSGQKLAARTAQLVRSSSRATDQDKRQGVVPASKEEAFRHVEPSTPEEPAPGLLGDVSATQLASQAAYAEPEPSETASSSAVLVPAEDDSDSYEQQLAELDVEFSLMVAKPAAQWQLESLMVRAEAISRAAPTPLLRGKARVLFEKIREFEQVQAGTTPIGAQLAPRPPYGGPPLAAGTAVGTGVARPGPRGLGRAATVPGASGARLPSLLKTLDSLMPPAPAPGPPPVSAPVYAGPPVATVSAQSPETAPPGPAGATWRSASTTRPPGPPASPNPVAADASGGVLGRIADRLLYPLGAAPGGAAAGNQLPVAYDGQGWLVPIVSRTGSAFSHQNYVPPFALTDSDGNILQFVTPAPGLNIHRYVRQQIGVFGNQRALEHLDQPHLTASRIVLLDRHRR